MVHYIINPWKYRHELLEVRKELYPAPHASTRDIEKGRNHAVALVSVWEQRGNCPHLVASTALLTAAILNDSPGMSPFCVCAVYSAAFSRFVTGLLDGYQDKKHKQSMYSIAKTIGLPSTFVELRHQAAHEDMPSLRKLRTATKRALQWIWDFYWKDLSPHTNHEADPKKMRSQTDGNTKGEKDIQIRSLDALRKELQQERRELADDSGSQTPLHESPIKDLESLKREMMVMEEDTESLDENIQGKEGWDILQRTDSQYHAARPSTLQDAAESEEEDNNYGWDAWREPWVARAIGTAG